MLSIQGTNDRNNLLQVLPHCFVIVLLVINTTYMGQQVQILHNSKHVEQVVIILYYRLLIFLP